MAKAAKQSVIVTVSKEHNINNVVRDLKAAGLEVEGAPLEAIGVVAGRAGPKIIPRLQKVRGVIDVSPDHKVDVGPPGAPITW